MLRDCPEPTEYVSKTYPIFDWKFCQNCHKQFRREWGWKYVKRTLPKIVIYNYICNKCGEDDKLYVGKMAYRFMTRKPPRPSPPSAPPKY
jgi:hypothetical protein